MTYKAADLLASSLLLKSSSRAALVLAAPKVLQALVAALGDYYTYKLAQQIYGKSSYPAWCTVWLTACSPWNWFVSTRTFSNCAETTLTIIALHNWPYHWALGVDEVVFQYDSQFLRVRQVHSITPAKEDVVVEVDETTKLRRALLAAGIAIVLRPTNAIIWLALTLATFGRGIYHNTMVWEINALVIQGLLCGFTVLTFSLLVDRLFYNTWTFPIWHFFKFNVLQSLAVFYGNNNWHYYLSQGYPLLMLAAVVPAIKGIIAAVAKPGENSVVSIQSRLILHRLALISLVLPLTLSILSHKEVRFIYPILPALHVLAALPLARYLGYPDVIGKASLVSRYQGRFGPKILVAFWVFNHILITVYFSYFHNSGLITLTDYLRTEFETRYQTSPIIHTTEFNKVSIDQNHNLTFAILMPCHSIPWRSHLQYPPSASQPGIHGWALTCEPPLNLSPEEKQTYQDEADIFYLNPSLWFKQNMANSIPKAPPSPGIYAPDPAASKKIWSSPNPRSGVWLGEGEGGVKNDNPKTRKRAWPDYLVFFRQLEPAIKNILAGSAYVECTSFSNSLFHDDWRRRGDIVVWCLLGRGNHEQVSSGRKAGSDEL